MAIPTDRPEWKALVVHRDAMDKTHMRDLFAEDGQRFSKFSIEYKGLLLDYSKNRINAETTKSLLSLARACEVEKWRDRMFDGEKINNTENRAVLHPALRNPDYDHSSLQNFSEKIRAGKWPGHTGKPIKNVVHIGIGGSSIGPRMVYESLKTGIENLYPVRFVSNIDGIDITQALNHSAPEETLFIVASKSFTTQETLENAKTAKDWLLAHLGNEADISKHFIALSSNTEKAAQFGIAPDNILPMEEGIGGRYSLWSSIGLPLCIALGFDNFRALLDGAHAMDRHFCEAPLEQNMPVILALLGIWYRNFQDMESYAVCPYSQDMRLFPSWLQQVDMESNGKSTNRDGKLINYKTGPVVFGETGTNCQHSFFQLLHQGTTIIPCDFIAPAKSLLSSERHHKILLSNMLAQSQALMQGDDPGCDKHRRFEGNCPSNTIILDRLDGFHLGMLLALYEHKIFVQGIIWNINSFDQWGVELGKVLAKNILDRELSSSDSSTQGLLDYLRIHSDAS